MSYISILHANQHLTTIDSTIGVSDVDCIFPNVSRWIGGIGEIKVETGSGSCWLPIGEKISDDGDDDNWGDNAAGCTWGDIVVGQIFSWVLLNLEGISRLRPSVFDVITNSLLYAMPLIWSKPLLDIFNNVVEKNS